MKRGRGNGIDEIVRGRERGHLDSDIKRVGD